MNVMAAICNSFSGRRSFALLTRSPGLNERAPVSLLFPTSVKFTADSWFDTETAGLLEINCLIPSLPLKDTMASSIEICGYGVHKLLNFSCK